MDNKTNNLYINKKIREYTQLTFYNAYYARVERFIVPLFRKAFVIISYLVIFTFIFSMFISNIDLYDSIKDYNSIFYSIYIICIIPSFISITGFFAYLKFHYGIKSKFDNKVYKLNTIFKNNDIDLSEEKLSSNISFCKRLLLIFNILAILLFTIYNIFMGIVIVSNVLLNINSLEFLKIALIMIVPTLVLLVPTYYLITKKYKFIYYSDKKVKK